MKKTILTSSMAILLGLGSLALSAQAETLRVGSEGAYAPWNYLDDDGKLAGFEMDLAQAICDEIKYDCEFVQNEWDTIIPNLVAGNYDVIMAGMSITDERKEKINFSEAYYPPNPSNYAVPAGKEYDFDKLSGLKIGVQGATIQAVYIEEKHASDNQILSYETPDQSIADLMSGNIDVLFAAASFLEPIMKETSDYEIIGPDIPLGDGVGAGVRKGDDELVEKINGALVTLKESGKLDELIMEYFEKGPYYKQ